MSNVIAASPNTRMDAIFNRVRFYTFADIEMLFQGDDIPNTGLLTESASGADAK